MPDTQAIAPNNEEFLKFIKDMRKDNNKYNSTVDDHISALAETEGWKDLKEWMLRKKARLIELKGYDLNGANYEEMGKLFYFARLVGEEIDSIISKVESTHKVIEKL